MLPPGVVYLVRATMTDEIFGRVLGNHLYSPVPGRGERYRVQFLLPPLPSKLCYPGRSCPVSQSSDNLFQYIGQLLKWKWLDPLGGVLLSLYSECRIALTASSSGRSDH